jgi:hypothetical protein
MTPVFSPVRLLGVAVLGAAFFLAGVTTAQAQAGNLPYQSGSAGLSYGGRQAILSAKLLNSRPRNLVRGVDGSLLDVSRRGSQAFLRSPETGAILPGGSPRRGWATGLGTGLGWGGMASAYSGALSYRYGRSSGADSMMQWISMLDMGLSQSYAGLSISESESPIDQWTGQNDLG